MKVLCKICRNHDKSLKTRHIVEKRKKNRRSEGTEPIVSTTWSTSLSSPVWNRNYTCRKYNGKVEGVKGLKRVAREGV